MDIQTLKIELTRLILETDQPDLLKRLLHELKGEKRDFTLNLSEREKREIDLSRAQIKNGETESWESVLKRNK